MPFQYANAANPRRTTRVRAPRSSGVLDRVDVFVAGLGTGGTLMGAGERLRESFPTSSSPPPSRFPATRSWASARSRTATCRRSSTSRKLDRKLLVSNAEAVAGLRLLLEREGVLRRRLVRRGDPRRAAARGGARRGRRRAASSPTAAGSTCPRTSGTPTTSRARWAAPSGGSPGRRARGARRAREGGVAERGVRARRHRGTASPSATSRAAMPLRRPYRFELDVPPETWFLEDEGYELAVFHSHLSSPPRPSRTDVENVGLWAGRPYLIYTVRTRRARRLADLRRVDRAAGALRAPLGTSLTRDSEREDSGSVLPRPT